MTENRQEETENRHEQDAESEVPSFISDPKGIDIVLFIAIIGMALYSFAMIPLRAYMLSHPLAYTLLVGGYTSATVSGANASEGNGTIPVYFVCMLFGALKFQLIYWYIGRRWGSEFIDMAVASMPRVKKWVDRALNTENRKAVTGALAFLPLGYMPGPVPGNIVNAVLGILRVGFWPILLVNILSVSVVNGVFMYLGYTYGEIVLDAVELISRYVLWITLALLAVMFFQMWRNSRKKS